MTKRYLIVFSFATIFCKFVQITAGNEQAEHHKHANDDNAKGSTWSLTSLLRQLGSHAVESWRSAQEYDDFEKDWEKVKSEPFNPIVLGSFLSNTTLPTIYRLTVNTKQGWIFIYKLVMNFTRRKCDKLIGSESPSHPWNLIKQNKETVSFVVFVYAVGLGIILVRLCNFQTFIGIASGTYMAYTFGGPYFCFRAFVFITGCGWLLLDTILSYPLQSAIICALLVLSSNILPYFNPMGNSRNQQVEFKQLKGKIDRLDRRFGDLVYRFENLEELIRDHAPEEE